MQNVAACSVSLWRVDATQRAGLASFLGLMLAHSLLAVPAQAAVTVGQGLVASEPVSQVTTVIVVSVDGLRSRAIRELGPQRAPVLHRLMRDGASTLNARAAREQTETLPNHASMVTSRRIKASRGGHGVTWNDTRLEPRTVHEAAGHRVASVFNKVSASGGQTALFASKQKFTLFKRSWKAAVDRFAVREGNARLVRLVRADLRQHQRAFRFVHLSRPDVVGHRRGFKSSAYLDAVASVDGLLGRIVATIENRGLSSRTVLVITSDHGGTGMSHDDPTKLANYRVPFLAWGAGVAQGADLYELNPDYANPGRRRTRYSEDRQPVRNGMVANLATDLLRLGPVRGSEHNLGQDLDIN